MIGDDSGSQLCMLSTFQEKKNREIRIHWNFFPNKTKKKQSLKLIFSKPPWIIPPNYMLLTLSSVLIILPIGSTVESAVPSYVDMYVRYSIMSLEIGRSLHI